MNNQPCDHGEPEDLGLESWAHDSRPSDGGDLQRAGGRHRRRAVWAGLAAVVVFAGVGSALVVASSKPSTVVVARQLSAPAVDHDTARTSTPAVAPANEAISITTAAPQLKVAARPVLAAAAASGATATAAVSSGPLCTPTALVAGVESVLGGTFTSAGLVGFGCSGAYAYTFDAVGPPPGATAGTPGVEETLLLEAQGDAWVSVARTICQESPSPVPAAIYQPACETN